jgi:phosphoribosylformylglycinamidine synthase
MVHRDQMVGKYQVPVADVAVTATSYTSLTGEAMAMGERTPLAVLNAAASARMAIGEAITNIAAASIESIRRIRLSANWMSSASHEGEGALLYDAVQAVGLDMCPRLGLTIPVGKDSMSMKTAWKSTDGESKSVTAPLSLIVTAYSAVDAIHKTWTPEIKIVDEPTALMLIDLGGGRMRMGGSILAQVRNQVGDACPDVDDIPKLGHFFEAMQKARREGMVLAYHDRSDGGLFTTLAEMAFTVRCGLNVELTHSSAWLEELFNEELGAVVQIRKSQVAAFIELLSTSGLVASDVRQIADVVPPQRGAKISVRHEGTEVYSETVVELQRWWSETSYRMQALRDNEACAQEEFDRISDETDPGLHYHIPFDATDPLRDTVLQSHPKVAILREQGVNGHLEMAYAFHRAGFQSVDVHMSDILNGRVELGEFKGLVACGGFSYGDVLGAGSGWANSILLNDRAQVEFKTFFRRPDTFALGVCNGCQMMAQLKQLIAPSETSGEMHWPRFVRNKSEQFEARFCMVEIPESPASSVWFRDMVGTRMPIAVAHGEGRTEYTATEDQNYCMSNKLVALRYTNNQGEPTELFPLNPNGSQGGATGFTSEDGRILIMMPHPERVVRSVALSWTPLDTTGKGWQTPRDPYADGPWLKMFANVRRWVG